MATFREKLKSKLPSRQEALPVFSTIVFFVFTWALYLMFNQVPAWLFFMNVWNVLVLTAYVLAFALFESGVMLAFMVLLSLVFPARLFKQKFVAQSVTLIVLMSIGAVWVQRHVSSIYSLVLWELITYPIFFLIAIVLLTLGFSFLYDRFKRLPRFIMSIADRMMIFFYVYVPLSLISIVVIIVRNV